MLGYTAEMWFFSLSTVQPRKQLMVWSSYFWFGALRTTVTGLSSALGSMVHISRWALTCPQIFSIQFSVLEECASPSTDYLPHIWHQTWNWQNKRKTRSNVTQEFNFWCTEMIYPTLTSFNLQGRFGNHRFVCFVLLFFSPQQSDRNEVANTDKHRNRH